MASSYKKTVSAKVSSPRASTSGASKFARVSSPKMAPLKTRIYTKGVNRSDPSEYAGVGFGDTGLAESPGLLGMSKSGLK